MYLEPAADGDHALAVRAGSSDSVHLALREGCSSSSPRVRDHPRLIISGTDRPVAESEFRLTPRGTEPIEPLPGVRFESTRVHSRSFETALVKKPPVVPEAFSFPLLPLCTDCEPLPCIPASWAHPHALHTTCISLPWQHPGSFRRPLAICAFIYKTGDCGYVRLTHNNDVHHRMS